MSTATKSATSRGERVAIRFSTLSPGSTVRSEFGRCCDPPLTPANALDALAAVVVESSGPATVVVATPPVTVVVAVTGFTFIAGGTVVLLDVAGARELFLTGAIPAGGEPALVELV